MKVFWNGELAIWTQLSNAGAVDASSMAKGYEFEMQPEDIWEEDGLRDGSIVAKQTARFNRG